MYLGKCVRCLLPLSRICRLRHHNVGLGWGVYWFSRARHAYTEIPLRPGEGARYDARVSAWDTLDIKPTTNNILDRRPAVVPEANVRSLGGRWEALHLPAGIYISCLVCLVFLSAICCLPMCYVGRVGLSVEIIGISRKHGPSPESRCVVLHVRVVVCGTLISTQLNGRC